VIAVTDLALRQGDFRLSGVEFAIPAGAYAVLMGKTGAGKTTLLEAICGLRPIERGAIRLDGRDVAGLPPGATAYALARASLAGAPPTLVVTADLDSARRMVESLRFFLGESGDDETLLPSVLLYPASDTTPYLDVAPDRRAAMDRLATLFHLALDLPVRFVVAPAAGLLRRIPPRASVKARSTLVERETEVDRDALHGLTCGGCITMQC